MSSKLLIHKKVKFRSKLQFFILPSKSRHASYNRDTILKSKSLNFDLKKSRYASKNRDTISLKIFKFGSGPKIALRHKNRGTILEQFSKK